MAHAEKCLICNGKGTVSTDKTLGEETCHGCGGKGWVEVVDIPASTLWPIVYPEPYYPWLPPPIKYWY